MAASEGVGAGVHADVLAACAGAVLEGLDYIN